MLDMKGKVLLCSWQPFRHGDKIKLMLKMEAELQELLLENLSLHLKRLRMNQQLLFYTREVMKLTWNDERTLLFHNVFLRYEEAPPTVDAHDGALPQEQVMELLKNNRELWAVNQSMSRDLRLLETKFEDLMVETTCDTGTMTTEGEEHQRNLQTLEDDVKALKLEMNVVKEEKIKIEEKRKCVDEEKDKLLKIMGSLLRDAEGTSTDVTGELKINIHDLRLNQLQPADAGPQRSDLQPPEQEDPAGEEPSQAGGFKIYTLTRLWRRFFTPG